MVIDWPFAGPAIDASGASIGTEPVLGHLWKVPVASAQPSWPDARSVPRTYTYTGSSTPDVLVIVSGIVAGTAAAGCAVDTTLDATAVTTAAARTRTLVIERTLLPPSSA